MEDLYKRQKEYFDKAYQKEETPWPNVEPTREIKEFLSLIRKEMKAGKVLDLGCGEGRHSFLFQKNGFKVWGVDYQPAALRKGKRRAERMQADHFGKPFFLAGDLFSLPFQEKSFDIVLDYGCLHHVKKGDFETYFRILLDLLKPQGYFLLSCFSTDYKHHAGERRKRDWLIHKGHYDRFFKKSEFVSLFGSQFDILRILDEKKGLSAFFHVLMRRK